MSATIGFRDDFVPIEATTPGAAVFPLPFTAFEHYMLADDRPDYPATAFVRMAFRGRIRRDRFHRAMTAALSWHPLLSARVEGSPEDRTAQLHWVPAPVDRSNVIWQSPSVPLRFDNAVRLDLRRQTGLRIWVLPSGESTQVVLQIHHACCDGLGALQFMAKLLTCYATGDESAPPSGWYERHALRNRISTTRSGRTWREWAATLRQDAARLRRFFWNRPVPVAAPRDGGRAIPTAEPNLPALLGHQFTEEETEQVRTGAGRLGVTVNTLLLRDLFLTIDEWNRAHSNDGLSRPLRIATPFNLRRTRPGATPAFNAVSIKFVNRRADAFADPRALLLGLDRELEEFKWLRRGTTLLPALRFLGRFRGGIASRLAGDRCLASAVFSNVGPLFAGSELLGADGLMQAGDLVLEEFQAGPPLRPGTRIGIATFLYGGRLSLNLCYDAHCFEPEDAAELLNLHVRKLRNSVDL